LGFLLSLLDTMDSIMLERLEGRQLPEDYNSWRMPMLAATGSYTAPHQDADGAGTALYCHAGHKLLFFPIDTSSRPLIVRFDDVDFDGALGLEYLFHPPHRYGHLVLSPGQTLWVVVIFYLFPTNPSFLALWLRGKCISSSPCRS
jgi:hypothetical protein